MRKVFTAVYLVIMGALVLSLSGCGGSSGGVLGLVSNPTTAQVAVIESPALEIGKTYKIIKGATLSGMNGAAYYVAPIGSDSNAATLNLGFAQTLGSETLAFIDTSTGNLVFAYDPSGEGSKTTGTVSYTGGTQMRYSGLTLNASTYSSMNMDSTDVKTIILNGNTATLGGSSVPVYDYVWHIDPQHPAQYWTDGPNGTTEYTSDEYEALIEAGGTNNGVYIARDIRYTPDTLEFTASQTAVKDQDTEYVVYYDFTSSAVREALASVVSTYGSAYSSDKYILATLPTSTGAVGGGMPGGQMPGGMSGDMPGDQMPGGETPPDGGPGGGTPPSFPTNGAGDESTLASIKALMTHSSADAYANPVLHITEPGIYELQGTWNGQIWVEVGAKAKHKVGIILNGVDVTCTVAPAMVFYKTYKWAEDNGYDDQATLTANDLWKTMGDLMMSSDGYYQTGTVVEIADGSTNTFTGANVYRILELCPKLDDDDNPKYTGSGIGTDISEQDKMYKFDAAFQSRRSMVIGGGSEGTGKLTITSTTCEGLGSEMHLTLDGGIISVTAPDDGINTNEDYVSVFTMLAGSHDITSTGGDGIDSNGWIALLGGKIHVRASQDSNEDNAQGDGPLDADNDVYIDRDNVTYTHGAASGSTQPTQPTNPASGDMQPASGDTPPTPPTNPTSGDTQPASSDIPPATPSESQDVTPPTPPAASSDVTPPTPTTPTTPDEPDTPSIPTTSPDVTPTVPTVPDMPTFSPDVTPPIPTVPDTPSIPTTSTDVTPNIPTIEPEPQITPTPDTTGVISETISGLTGTTTFSLEVSGSVTPVPDTDTTPRGIAAYGNVFPLTRKVNTFAGISEDN
ncbi:MAG: carbohydrate-binding domain-containing protein [Synergistaceae bacterium]|nr:carbohydrate-binding domain-containing protein [Synergistaceae bacterium]